jgi:DNA-binding MarR family transcriptional regulator
MANKTTKNRVVLEQFVPYQLSFLANRVSASIARHYETRFGLSIPQWRIIAVLGEMGQSTAQHIAQRTAMDKTTVSRAVRALAARKLVQRALLAEDARASTLTLTKKGRDIYQEVTPFALACEQSLLAGFSAADRMHLSRLLKKLNAGAAVLSDA